MEESDRDILVTNPLGHSAVVNKVYRGYPLRIQGYEFSADLIELPFHEFNVILGMDWLSRHQAIVNCKLKRITLKLLRMKKSQLWVKGQISYLMSSQLLLQ